LDGIRRPQVGTHYVKRERVDIQGLGLLDVYKGLLSGYACYLSERVRFNSMHVTPEVIAYQIMSENTLDFCSRCPY